MKGGGLQEHFVRMNLHKSAIQKNGCKSIIHLQTKRDYKRNAFSKSSFFRNKINKMYCRKVFDVIIDLRKNSATFLKWFGVELSAENKKMIYIPEGFAHGFQTLTDGCQLFIIIRNIINLGVKEA